MGEGDAEKGGGSGDSKALGLTYIIFCCLGFPTVIT